MLDHLVKQKQGVTLAFMLPCDLNVIDGSHVLAAKPEVVGKGKPREGVPGTAARTTGRPPQVLHPSY